MTSPDPVAGAAASVRHLASPIEMRHIGGFGFPTDELVADDVRVARLGRDGSLKIFFGPGRRVVLTDGTEWRIKSATSGRFIMPIVSSQHGTVGFAGPLPGKRSYGITGRDFAFNLVPLGRVGLRTPGLWGIRDRQDEIGRLRQRARLIHVDGTFPIAAALLAFTVVAHGIPGEADLLR